ncbi:hypothetical protein QUB05_10630 [Microcoleus sp. F10-C6]|uniref:hypothetical protein n=1 Tax=unclassified Microcoleus TaxID=2642155 RepID=UPI002FD1157C
MIDEVKLLAVIQAIARVRQQIIGKPGKAISHLLKRTRLGHLPDDATLEQYNVIIAAVANSLDADVYLYVYGETIYPTLVANMENKVWLVMISLEGVLETAFPPDRPESYLANSAFVYLCSVKELEI